MIDIIFFRCVKAFNSFSSLSENSSRKWPHNTSLNSIWIYPFELGCTPNRAVSSMVPSMDTPLPCPPSQSYSEIYPLTKKTVGRSPSYFMCCHQVLLLLIFLIMKAQKLHHESLSEHVCSICETSEWVFSGFVGWHPPVCIKIFSQGNKTSFHIWDYLKCDVHI